MESNKENITPESPETVSTGEAGAESGATPDLDIPDLEAATDEQLEAFLKGEANAVTEDGQVVSAAEPDAKTKGDEGKTAATEATPPADSVQAVDPEYVKKLEAQRAQQEAFIQRQQTEYGEMKKQLKIAKEQLAGRNAAIQKALEDGDMLDPGKVVDHKLEIQKNQQTLEALEQTENEHDLQNQAVLSIKRNYDVVEKNLKPEEWDMNSMVQTLQGDGVPPQIIQHFAANPYAATDGLTLVQIAKRAKAESAVRQLAGYVLKLREQLDTEKKKPGAILRNVQKNLSATKTLTNASGTSGATKGRLSVDASQLESLSDAELEAIIEQNT